MIHKEKPENFNSKFDVVSCFVEHDGEILLLHRQDHKPQGNTWGVPAGKVDDGQEILETMIREIQEETGFMLPSSELSYFGKVFVRYPEYDFVYHMYHTELNQRQDVVISQQEHKDFKWISPKKALEMNLIQDLDACIRLFYKK
ncbi:MAG: NUDIX hydrolase [Candidatus Pacebacteria bacterium]|nr:NUDIX hydrolase [Candidatus Paceibacterota bacterium]